ncbi:MAG: DUF3850 domain-containing protein [Bacteroidia bacterium]
MSETKTTLSISETGIEETTHHLKTRPIYFELVLQGIKTFEVRKDDRNFKTQDFIELKEYDHGKEWYTGRKLKKRIGYILRGGQFGIEPGYCVIQLKDI